MSTTFSFKIDQDVSGATVNLPKIQRDDVTVNLQSLGYGGIHVFLTQVWCVVIYPVCGVKVKGCLD